MAAKSAAAGGSRTGKRETDPRLHEETIRREAASRNRWEQTFGDLVDKSPAQQQRASSMSVSSGGDLSLQGTSWLGSSRVPLRTSQMTGWVPGGCGDDGAAAAGASNNNNNNNDDNDLPLSAAAKSRAASARAISALQSSAVVKLQQPTKPKRSKSDFNPLMQW